MNIPKLDAVIIDVYSYVATGVGAAGSSTFASSTLAGSSTLGASTGAEGSGDFIRHDESIKLRVHSPTAGSATGAGAASSAAGSAIQVSKISKCVPREDVPVTAGAGSAAAAVSVGAASFVGVASTGFAASVGLSASSFLLFFPLNKPLTLALNSDNALGAIDKTVSASTHITGAKNAVDENVVAVEDYTHHIEEM